MANVYWDTSDSEVEYAYDLSEGEEEEDESATDRSTQFVYHIKRAIKNVYVQCKRDYRIKMDLLDFLFSKKQSTRGLDVEFARLLRKMNRLRYLYNNVKVDPNAEAEHGLLLDPFFSVHLPPYSEPLNWNEWSELLRLNYFCFRHVQVFCICKMSISMLNCVH